MKLTREQKLLQTLVNKAWEDESFKQELIADPIRVIESVIDSRVKLPEGKTIVVRDQSDASVIYINIPAKPNMEDMELNEEQLEIVAGGGVLTTPVITDSSANLSGCF